MKMTLGACVTRIARGPLVWLGVGVVLACGVTTSGDEPADLVPRELPALELRRLDGSAAGADALPRSGRWIFVYVTAQSGPSRELLAVVRDTGTGPLLVVVSGTPKEAGVLAREAGAAAHVTWLVDPDASAGARLGIQAVPLVMGVDGHRIAWRLTGSLSNRRTLRSIVASWR